MRVENAQKKHKMKALYYMKRKHLAYIATALLTTTLFSACGNVASKTSFYPYWQKNAIITEDVSETLVYDVLFTKGTSPLYNYTLEYQTGTFTTTLKSTVTNGEFLYEYTTDLRIKGTYSFEENVFSFEDYVTSTVTFKNTANSLAPVTSTKEFCSHSPQKVQASAQTKFADWKVKGSVTVDHTTKKSSITMEGYEKPAEKDISLTKQNEKYSYLDNEQLWIALRGVEQTANSAPKFSVYAPFTGKVQTVAATFSASVTEENFSFELNGDPITQNMTYFPVQLTLDEKNKGSAQTLWIAAAQDVKNNTYRNVILKNIVTIPYGIGTFTYQLKSAAF